MAKGQPTLPAGRPTYTKINSLFKRAVTPGSGQIRGTWIPGSYSTKEFQYLISTPWQWTEKVDGTNIRVGFGSDARILVGGKSDRAQLPSGIIQAVQRSLKAYDGEWFDRDRLDEISPKDLDRTVIFGEGYGPGIQKDGGLYGEEKGFIAYDIRIGDYWLPRSVSLPMLRRAEIPTVKSHCAQSPAERLYGMLACVEDLQPDVSAISSDKHKEGYVGVPMVPLFDARGDRIIVKLTYRDVELLSSRWKIDEVYAGHFTLISRDDQADGQTSQVTIGSRWLTHG